MESSNLAGETYNDRSPLTEVFHRTPVVPLNVSVS